MASPGSIAAPCGSNHRRFTYSCPSGNRWLIWCAQCTAREVFPTPAVPAIAVITTARSKSPSFPATSECSRASSASRPVKSGIPRGSWAGVGGRGSGSGAALTAAGCAVGPASVGSVARIRMCSCCNWGVGSTPSSSARYFCASRKAASASACRPER